VTPWQSAARRLAGDRGSVTVIGAAIIFPVVIVLISACFQAGFWFTARDAAVAAAQQGADAARADGATLQQGEDSACGFAARTAPGILRDPDCTGTAGPATITITVCGDAISLLPGLPVRACEQVQGARERFTTRTSP
jgi:Flp pilus assembly protein TadG